MRACCARPPQRPSSGRGPSARAERVAVRASRCSGAFCPKSNIGGGVTHRPLAVGSSRPVAAGEPRGRRAQQGPRAPVMKSQEDGACGGPRVDISLGVWRRLRSPGARHRPARGRWWPRSGGSDRCDSSADMPVWLAGGEQDAAGLRRGYITHVRRGAGGARPYATRRSRS